MIDRGQGSGRCGKGPGTVNQLFRVDRERQLTFQGCYHKDRGSVKSCPTKRGYQQIQVSLEDARAISLTLERGEGSLSFKAIRRIRLA